MSEVIGTAAVEVTADASGFEAALERLTTRSRRFENDAVSAADKAGAAVAGIGKQAEAGVSVADRATRQLIASIERATALANAGERGTARFFESLAQQRGAKLDVLQPYIESLAKAQSAQAAFQRDAQKIGRDLGLVGVSAGQASAAMRQLPAQLTDIFTQLQGGQSVITVLTQQGGQLRDSFGSVGNVFRALSSVIAPATLAFGGLAAVAGGLGAAFINGAREAEDYRRAIALTGNAAGVTVGQLQAAAEAVSRSAGTQSQAAEVIAQLVSTGRVAAADLGKLAEAAIRLEREGGPAVKETVAAFAELGKSPTQGALKLNEATRFLTISVYEQIRSLEEQGKTADAARVAQTAYADEAIARTRNLESQLGAVETAWRGVTGAAKGAWNAILDIGREGSVDQKLLDIQSRLSMAARLQEGAGSSLLHLIGKRIEESARDDLTAFNRQRIRDADTAMAQRAAAAATEEFAKAREAVGKWAESTRTASEKASKAVEQYRAQIKLVNEELLKAGKAPLATPAEIEKTTRAIEASFAPKEREKKVVDEIAKAYETLAKRMAGDIVTATAELQAEQLGLNKAQTEFLKIAASPEWASYDEGRRKAIALLTAERSVLEDNTAAWRRQRDEQAKAFVDAAKFATDVFNRTAAMEAENEALTLQVGAIGRSAYALAVLEAARVRDNAAAKEAQAIRFADRDGYEEQARALREEARLLRERAALIEQRAAVVLDDDQRRDLERVRREELDAWQRTSDQIGDALANALMQGGRSAAEYIKGVFRAMVLRPIIQAAVQPIASQVLGVLGSNATGSGSSMNWMGAAQTGAGAVNAYRNLAETYQKIAQWFGIGTTTASGLAAGGGAAATVGSSGVSAGAIMGDSSGVAASSAAQTGAGAASWLPYVGWALAAYQGADRAFREGFTQDSINSWGVERFHPGSLMQGVLSAVGHDERWSSILSGASVVSRLWGQSAPRITAQGIAGMFGAGDFSGQAFADIEQRNGYLRSLFSGGSERSTQFAELPGDIGRYLDEAAAAVLKKAEEFGAALGLPAERLASITSDIRVELTDDAEANQKALVEALARYGEALVEGFAANVEPLRRYGETTAQTIERVAGALLGVNKVLDAVGLAALETSVAGGTAADALVGAFGGLDAFAQASSGYFASFFTEAERTAQLRAQLTETFASYGETLPATREGFRTLVEAQNLMTASGREGFTVLMGLAGAFNDLVTAEEAAAAATGELMTRLEDARLQRLPPEQRAAAAYAGIAGDLASFGITTTPAALMRATAEEILATAQAFVSAAGASAEAKQAVTQAALALLGLKDAAAEAAEKEAEAARDIADRRAGLEIELLRAQGRETEALARERKAELAALRLLDPALASVKEAIFAATDAANLAARRGALDQEFRSVYENVAPRFMGAQDRINFGVSVVSRNLREAGVDVNDEQLRGLDRQGIVDAALAFIQLNTVTAEAKIAVGNAAGALLDLIEASEQLRASEIEAQMAEITRVFGDFSVLDPVKTISQQFAEGRDTLEQLQHGAYFGERDRRFRDRDRFGVGAGLRGEHCRDEVEDGPPKSALIGSPKPMHRTWVFEFCLALFSLSWWRPMEPVEGVS